jgi:hypothetical protein
MELKYDLAYLFECHFADGTVLQQTPEDLSKTEPNKSAFYDVLQRNDEVIVFGIVNDDHTYAVDLRDGHFEIDGVPLYVHGQDELPPDTKYRVVYFRRVSHMITQGYEIAESAVKYHIGWQATVDGKNYQKTIAVS